MIRKLRICTKISFIYPMIDLYTEKPIKNSVRVSTKPKAGRRARAVTYARDATDATRQGALSPVRAEHVRAKRPPANL